jgi:predicted ester cyclase
MPTAKDTAKNKATVRRIIEEVINEGRLDLVDELVAEDYVDHANGPDGRDGYRQSVAVVRAAFPDLRMAIEDLIAEGEMVVARLSIEATHDGEFMGIRPTGRRVTFTGISVIRVVGGRMVERWNQSDIVGVLKQLGAELYVEEDA